MKTTTGTCHFSTFACAVVYYYHLGFNHEDVAAKVEAKEIVIGKPEVKPGQELLINEEGRYMIKE